MDNFFSDLKELIEDYFGEQYVCYSISIKDRRKDGFNRLLSPCSEGCWFECSNGSHSKEEVARGDCDHLQTCFCCD